MSYANLLVFLALYHTGSTEFVERKSSAKEDEKTRSVTDTVLLTLYIVFYTSNESGKTEN